MAHRNITYSVQLVGGPYDGIPGLYWTCPIELDPPEVIKVGVCPGDGLCSAAQAEMCRRISRGRAHPCFWTDGEEMPEQTIEYRRHEVRKPSGEQALAIYVAGSVSFDRVGEEPEFKAPDRVPDWLTDRPLVTAENVREVCDLWQALPPRLTAEQRARMFDPALNVRMAAAYIAARYGGKWEAWRPGRHDQGWPR